MAEQIGIGTLLGSDFVVTGYADENGRRLIRQKSRLDKLKWQRSPDMKWSREAARQFGAASTIAGGIWKNVPGGLKRLMDAGAFNRLVGICRILQEWDGNLSDFDGFRNLDLSEESYGPHRVVRCGDGWGVSGIVELMGELDRVTVVCLNQNFQNSPNSQDLEQNCASTSRAPLKQTIASNSQNSLNSQDLEQNCASTSRAPLKQTIASNSQNSLNSQNLDGGLGAGASRPSRASGPDDGALGQCDTRVDEGGGDLGHSGALGHPGAGGRLREPQPPTEGAEGRDAFEKRWKKIRRMAGVVSERNFKHDTGRFWDRVEDVYGQEEKPRVRYWEGRGMFDYGRVTPPRIVLGQRFLRSPYVSCWPFEANLGKLDCLNPNSPNSPNFKNGVRVRQNWECEERPDRRVRLWVQACEIGRVREVGGRKGARYELDTVGCSPLGSSGYVTPWRVIRGRADESGLRQAQAPRAMRDESGLGADFDEGSKMPFEPFESTSTGSVWHLRDLRAQDESLKQNLQNSPNLQNLGGGGLSLVGHGGTGVFVVIGGIEVAEKRGRHWVRLPWCCKARVVDVICLNQNFQDSQDSQNGDGLGEQLWDGVDMEVDGSAVEFKGVRRELVIRLPVRVDFTIGGLWGIGFWETGFRILNP